MRGVQQAAPSLSIGLFGPMQAQIQGQPLPLPHARKVRWLLALLTLHHDKPVQREWLARTLWPEVEGSQGLANLRPALSELRKALGSQKDHLTSSGPDTIRFALTGPDVEVDVLTFDERIARGDTSALEEALALYKGPLLEGCTEEWALEERMTRELKCLQALQKLGDEALADQAWSDAAHYFQRAVRLDPLWEAGQRGWMEALAAKGDTNAALQIYRDLVAFLGDDPSAVPDQRTTAIYERLRREVRKRSVTHAVVDSEIKVAPSVQGSLPHAVTGLVGREDESLEVALRLRRVRLVTLTGVGGIGKTRLARVVADQVVQEYEDGVWLVPLESLADGRVVIQQIASVLGLRDEPNRSPLQTVTAHLRSKRLLLVLDNCEHLIDTCAQLAIQLLADCPHLRILATSREPLGVTGETVWKVPALSVPDSRDLLAEETRLPDVLMGYQGVELFVRRARSASDSFALTEDNGSCIAQLCLQLEGIPLAIELAAARTRELALEQIAAHFRDRPETPKHAAELVASRHATLRATLDWSYDLLTEAERLLLKRLSVFAGGCDLESAALVCGGEGIQPDVADVLTWLVDKSLVLFEGRSAARGRYRLLEMVRQYAADGLQASGHAEHFKQRHRDRFLALAEEAEPDLKLADQKVWLERLEIERDNLRTALSFCESDPAGAQLGLRLAGALSDFWRLRGGYEEGRASIEKALARADAQKATISRAKALNGAGGIAYRQSDYASAREFHEKALSIQHALGDRAGIASSLLGLGEVAADQGDYTEAGTMLEESLGIARELGDHRGIATCLSWLGDVAVYQGELDLASHRYEESLSLWKQLCHPSGVSNVLEGLGCVAHDRRDYPAARRLYEESLSIRRELGDKHGMARTLNSLGSAMFGLGDEAAARTVYEEALAVGRQSGQKGTIAETLAHLGHLASVSSELDTAWTLSEEALTLVRELRDPFMEAHILLVLAHIACCRCDYDVARQMYGNSLEISRESGNQGRIGRTLALWGHLEKQVSDHRRAGELYREALLAFKSSEDSMAMAYVFDFLASLASHEGQSERAAQLAGAAQTLAPADKRPKAQQYPPQYDMTVSAARQALGEEDFARHWEAGRAMQREKAIALALEDISAAHRDS